MSVASTSRLWFDVERGYKTTLDEIERRICLLWFDVERGYKTTENYIID